VVVNVSELFQNLSKTYRMIPPFCHKLAMLTKGHYIRQVKEYYVNNILKPLTKWGMFCKRGIIHTKMVFQIHKSDTTFTCMLPGCGKTFATR